MLSRCPPLQVVRNRKCVVPFVELNSGDKASYIWDFLLMLHQLPSLFQLPGYVMTLQIQTGQDPAHNQSVAILLQSHNPYLPDVTDYSTASTLKFLGPDQQCDTIQITNLSGSFFFFFLHLHLEDVLMPQYRSRRRNAMQEDVRRWEQVMLHSQKKLKFTITIWFFEFVSPWIVSPELFMYH